MDTEFRNTKIRESLIVDMHLSGRILKFEIQKICESSSI